MGVLGISMDITDQKKTEELERILLQQDLRSEEETRWAMLYPVQELPMIFELQPRH